MADPQTQPQYGTSRKPEADIVPGTGTESEAGERTKTTQGQSHAYTEQAAEATRSAAHDVREAAREYGHELQQRGRSMVEHQQHGLADKLDRIGDAFHHAAEDLYSSNDNTVAACIDGMANRAHGAASYLRDHETADLMQTAASYTKRHPWQILGGAFLVGMTVSRFIKASAPDQPQRETEGRQAQASAEFGEEFRTPEGPENVTTTPPPGPRSTGEPGARPTGQPGIGTTPPPRP